MTRPVARAALTRLAAFFLAAIALACAALALDLPQLTGRVVDTARILSPQAREALDAKLEALETRSGIQFVVATVPSLEGSDIETYANSLFRDWKLGEKAKNNGVLFLVAPTERKVRIEVGYGLEGVLTDALSKVVIVNAVAPRFKAGDFDGGVDRGVDDVITILTTDSSEWQKRPDLRLVRPDPAARQSDRAVLIFLFVVIVLIVIIGARGAPPGSRSSRAGRSGGGWGGFSGGGGFGGGGFGGGGFSGGGGSSGGGGASGGW